MTPVIQTFYNGTIGLFCTKWRIFKMAKKTKKAEKPKEKEPETHDEAARKSDDPKCKGCGSPKVGLVGGVLTCHICGYKH